MFDFKRINRMNCRVSVVMASYNGEKYISEQIDSILTNLDENDELVISDDGSTDETLHIIDSYIQKDSRIKLVKGPGKGVKANFANAMKNSSGNYIFLSDQDDVWFKNKINQVLLLLANHDLVVHDCVVTKTSISDVIIPSFFVYRKSGAGVLKNIWKNTYIGCCMAFSRRLMKRILPIADDIEMHDQWIGILNDIFYKNTYFLKKQLIYYRRHDTNVSSFNHFPLNQMLHNRVVLIKELVKARNSQ